METSSTAILIEELNRKEREEEVAEKNNLRCMKASGSDFIGSVGLLEDEVLDACVERGVYCVIVVRVRM